MVAMPRNGERILVVRNFWLQLLLNKTKTLEVRSKRLGSRTYLLGCRGKAYARIHLAAGFEIKSDSSWRQLRCEHHVDTHCKPYRRTFGHQVLDMEMFEQPITYEHPKGAIGIVVYRQQPIVSMPP